MTVYNLRSLLVAAIVLSNCITWTASRRHHTHTQQIHRTRHRRQGQGLFLLGSYVIPGGEGTGWGEWRDDSPCSRTCGGGVASQKRICLQIGPDGQPQCTGGDTKYFSCQTQDCPPDAGDFRAEQCSAYDDKDFRGVKYEWIPYTKSPNPCELNCMPRGERFYYRHSEKVIDGTRCNDDSFDVCVNGVCQPVGCDMMLGSNAREDKCRQCRGNGVNCYTHSELIDRQDLIKGYNDLLLIPAGATTILIEEIAPSNNYLALRNNNNTYYLNGQYRIDFARTMMIAGALWTYDRSQSGFAAPDKLRCLGPTNETLILSLLLLDNNVGIKYEYSLPTRLAPKTDTRYNWVTEEFTNCSAACGGGIQTRNVTCRSSEELEVVDDKLCDENLKPATNQTCNTDVCPPEWVEEPWGECSKRCGNEGIRKREVTCQQIIANGYPSLVADSECFKLHGKKPELFQECNRDAVCPQWFIGRWKACDKLCGSGVQTREVICYQKKNGRIEVLDEVECEEEKPAIEKPCMLAVCEGTDWIATAWSGCDSCLSKVQTRQLVCASVLFNVYDDSFCDYHNRPITERPCDESKLPPCEAQWYATQWSKCSVECGDGVQTRRVFCGVYESGSVREVEDKLCADLPKYNDTKTCSVPIEECPSQWFTGPWGKCDAECDGGERVRRLMCLKGSKVATNCPVELSPETAERCNLHPCNADEVMPMTTTIKDEDENLVDCEEEEPVYEEVGVDEDVMVSDGVTYDPESTFTFSTFDTGSGSGDYTTDDYTTEDTVSTDTDSTDSTISTEIGATDGNETETTSTDTGSTEPTIYSTESNTTDISENITTSIVSSLSTEIAGSTETDETDTTGSDSTIDGSTSSLEENSTTTRAETVITETSETASTSNDTDATDETETSNTESTITEETTTSTGLNATDDTSSTDTEETELTESTITDITSSDNATTDSSATDTGSTESGSTDVSTEAVTTDGNSTESESTSESVATSDDSSVKTTDKTTKRPPPSTETSDEYDIDSISDTAATVTLNPEPTDISDVTSTDESSTVFTFTSESNPTNTDDTTHANDTETTDTTNDTSSYAASESTSGDTDSTSVTLTSEPTDISDVTNTDESSTVSTFTSESNPTNTDDTTHANDTETTDTTNDTSSYAASESTSGDTDSTSVTLTSEPTDISDVTNTDESSTVSTFTSESNPTNTDDTTHANDTETTVTTNDTSSYAASESTSGDTDSTSVTLTSEPTDISDVTNTDESSTVSTFTSESNPTNTDDTTHANDTETTVTTNDTSSYAASESTSGDTDSTSVTLTSEPTDISDVTNTDESSTVSTFTSESNPTNTDDTTHANDTETTVTTNDTSSYAASESTSGDTDSTSVTLTSEPTDISNVTNTDESSTVSTFTSESNPTNTDDTTHTNDTETTDTTNENDTSSYAASESTSSDTDSTSVTLTSEPTDISNVTTSEVDSTASTFTSESSPTDTRDTTYLNETETTDTTHDNETISSMYTVDTTYSNVTESETATTSSDSSSISPPSGSTTESESASTESSTAAESATTSSDLSSSTSADVGSSTTRRPPPSTEFDELAESTEGTSGTDTTSYTTTELTSNDTDSTTPEALSTTYANATIQANETETTESATTPSDLSTTTSAGSFTTRRPPPSTEFDELAESTEGTSGTDTTSYTTTQLTSNDTDSTTPETLSTTYTNGTTYSNETETTESETTPSDLSTTTSADGKTTRLIVTESTTAESSESTVVSGSESTTAAESSTVSASESVTTPSDFSTTLSGAEETTKADLASTTESGASTTESSESTTEAGSTTEGKIDTTVETSTTSGSSSEAETTTSGAESTTPEQSTTVAGETTTSADTTTSNLASSTESSTTPGSEATTESGSTIVSSTISGTESTEFKTTESETTTELVSSTTSEPESSTTSGAESSATTESETNATESSTTEIVSSTVSSESSTTESAYSTTESIVSTTTEESAATTVGGLSTTEAATTEETTSPSGTSPRFTFTTKSSKGQCKPRKKKAKCELTQFGCCPDRKTPADGPFDQGCPKRHTCKDTVFGCCPDGVSPAQGNNTEGCPVTPCEETLFGCCLSDNKTAAQGNDQDGCPPPPPACASTPYGCCADNETEAAGPNAAGCPETETTSTTEETTTTAVETTTTYSSTIEESTSVSSIATTESSTTIESSETSTTVEGSTTVVLTSTVLEGCVISEFGCCSDNETAAPGPDGQGCPCNATEYGCCPDGVSTAQGENDVGCQGPCKESTYGCCPDDKTPAHGPDYEGCCLQTRFGCCPDNRKPAQGPHLEGCKCENSQYGCCSDNVTAASGPNNEGCGCQYTPHGCCPDRHTPALGPDFEGCSCHTYQFGCCPDGVSIPIGPDQQGCHCRFSAYGCCGDDKTPASGPNGAGCDCSSSKYGCCPDGQTPAEGPKFRGCAGVPENQQAVCNRPQDTGPCRDYRAMWFYDVEFAGCSQFWYGGCEGNGNKFETKDECEDVCVHPAPKDACNLPAMKGPCDGDYVHWYYNSTEEQCKPFRYGGCLGNDNNFDSEQLCQTQCQPEKVIDTCELPIEAGPCAGNFSGWGFNSESGKCEQFIWGGCGGNSNRFKTEAACKMRCNPTAIQCNEPQETGNCTDKEALWSFSQSENRCVPFYYSGCGGNNNKFYSKESCQQTCPSAYEPDKCTLPPAPGDCSPYRLKWFYDTAIKRCRQFYYGGCGGNENNFETEAQCESACHEVPVTTTTTTTARTQPQPQPQPDSNAIVEEPSVYCLHEIDKGERCSSASPEIHYAYDSRLGKCVSFQFLGCGGNQNNFVDEAYCAYYCHPVQDVCQLPMLTGSCGDSIMAWFYDAGSDSCSQFTYSGCDGNDNRFESREACESRCRTGVEPAHVVTTHAPTVAIDSRLPEIVPPECAISPSLEECTSAGEVWFFDSERHECVNHMNPGSGAECRHTGTYSSQEACERSCGVFRGVDVCTQVVDPGPCRQFVAKVYFDQESRTCKQFAYGGCHGGANRFSSIQECQQTCQAHIEPCEQPLEPGECNGYVPQWYYDATYGCTQFVYTGCGGNANRFETKEECKNRCRRPSPSLTTTTLAPVPEPEPESECTTPRSLAPCGGNRTVFYYDSSSKSCVASEFGNCRHPNSYASEEACERRCGAFRGLNVCHARLDTGPCRNPVPKYYFDAATGSCQAFTYSGCAGGPNRFSTMEECQDICGDSGPAPQCLLRVDTGYMEGCREPSVTRYHYSPSRADCIVFVYTGCGGNANNFPSYQQCRQACVRLETNEVGCESYERQCASLKCKYGVVRAPARGGCESCACADDTARCDQLRQECDALVCPFGVVRVQEDGCDRCQCAEDPCVLANCASNQRCVATAYTDPDTGEPKYTARCTDVEPDCRQQREYCDQLRCEFGIERSGDSQGCESCQCAPTPCETKVCPTGERCVLSPYRDIMGETKYSPECRPTTKPGHCPVEPPAPNDDCRSDCDDDADCRGVGKCCARGCGRRCAVPAASAPPLTTTYAPEIPAAPLAVPQQEPEMTATEGGKAVLRCLFHGNPPPRITWRFGELTIDGDVGRYRLTSEGALEIISLYRNDTGVYICVADNALGRATQEVRLVVNVPVSTHVSTSYSSLRAGQELRILCEVDGYPDPSVYWTKDSARITPDDRISITGSAAVSRLVIAKVAVTDSGLYSCHAANDYSSATDNAQISVQQSVLPAKCTDNPFFANCDLIVRSKFCNHKYYSKFCCKSCVEAGQLDPRVAEMQADQPYRRKK